MRYIVSFIVAMSCVASVHAVYISEIMYDPTGSDSPHEWIEIYNDSGSSINFTAWKFFESSTNHGITSYSGGSSVSADGYAVIADNAQQFLTDYPSYTGVLYDSSFSLSNSGEQLILKDGALLSVDTFTYNTTLGGNNDGSTLSKIDGVWVRGNATPGATNQSSPLSSSSSDSSATTTSNQSVIAQMSPPSPDIVLYMPFEKTVVAGAEAEFSTYGMTRGGNNISNLIATWAFGDGGRGVGTSTKYIYAYPGRYIAQVEGGNGSVLGTGRMVVHVVPPDITIAKIGTGKYGTYVDINNPNNYDLDLSQWKLLINGSGYSFPKNTLIAGNSTTRFSGIAMGFASTTVSPSTTVKILFPNLEEVTKYVVETELVENVSTSSSPIVKLPIVQIVSKPILHTLRATTTTQKIVVNPTLTTTQINKTNQIKPRTTKDTRIVSWFKSFFGR